MKHMIWAFLVAALIGYHAYREGVHSDSEAAMTSLANRWHELANEAKDKYQETSELLKKERAESLAQGGRVKQELLRTMTSMEQAAQAIEVSNAAMTKASTAMRAQRDQIEELKKQRDTFKEELAKAIRIER